MNNGVQQGDRNVVTRGSEASADSRCLIIDTGLVQSPVGRFATARHKIVKMELNRRSNDCHGTREAGLQDLAYVIVKYAVAWRCGCEFVVVTTPNLTDLLSSELPGI
jgi:hypothetical protein